METNEKELLPMVTTKARGEWLCKQVSITAWREVRAEVFMEHTEVSRRTDGGSRGSVGPAVVAQ